MAAKLRTISAPFAAAALEAAARAGGGGSGDAEAALEAALHALLAKFAATVPVPGAEGLVLVRLSGDDVLFNRRRALCVRFLARCGHAGARRKDIIDALAIAGDGEVSAYTCVAAARRCCPSLSRARTLSYTHTHTPIATPRHNTALRGRYQKLCKELAEGAGNMQVLKGLE